MKKILIEDDDDNFEWVEEMYEEADVDMGGLFGDDDYGGGGCGGGGCV